MNESRLTDYLDHMQQAATDACSFVTGLNKDEFLADKRTQQAVIMMNSAPTNDEYGDDIICQRRRSQVTCVHEVQTT